MRPHLMKTIAAAVTAIGLTTAVAAPWQSPVSAPPPSAAQPSPAPAPVPPATAAPAAAADFQPSTPAEKAVMGRVAEFTAAYTAADATALTALYADDAVIVDPDGLEIRGKEEIGRLYAESFAEGAGLKLEAHVEALRFLTPDVARVEGRSRIASAAGDAADYLRFSTLIVQKGGAWTIAEIREYPAPAEDVQPYDRLKDLEWMVGEWVDEGEHHKVSASIKWAENRSYLIRTHSAEIDGQPRSSATMFIGWDPQSGQIKSWLFDSEGGRGEGTWSRVGEDQWVVKAFGVMRNGLPNSSTQIHTILNKDSVRTDSVDRIIGGQVEEDIVDLVMVRKAPAPGAAAPGAK